MNWGQLSWGEINRLAQFFKPDKRGEYHTVMLAVDHSYFQGPTTGLINPIETIRPLVKYADAISPPIGTLKYCLDPLVPVPVILRITGGNSITRREELSDEHIITSVEEAVRLNAIGVSVSVYIDSEHQAQTIKNLGTAATEARKYGLLVLGITAVGAKLEKMIKGEGETKDKKKLEKMIKGEGETKDNKFDFGRYLAHAGRILQENGANIVKTYFTKNPKDFEQVRKGIQVPIVIAGGEKVPELEALQYTEGCIRAGAEGVDMGRNIFQAENPTAMIQAVRSIVHEGTTAEQAYKFYKKEKLKALAR